MGTRIKKLKDGEILEFSVKFLESDCKIEFRKELTAWCKSDAIKNKFYVFEKYIEEPLQIWNANSPGLHGKTSGCGRAILIFNNFDSYTNYIVFDFEDQADAALFKMFWS